LLCYCCLLLGWALLLLWTWAPGPLPVLGPGQPQQAPGPTAAAGHRPSSSPAGTTANSHTGKHKGGNSPGHSSPGAKQAQGTAAQGQKPRAMATRQSPAGPAKGNHRPHSPYILVGGACVLPAVYTPGAWPVLTPWGNSPKHSPPQAPKQAHRPRAGQCLAQGRPQASRQAQAAAETAHQQAQGKQGRGKAGPGHSSPGQAQQGPKQKPQQTIGACWGLGVAGAC